MRALSAKALDCEKVRGMETRWVAKKVLEREERSVCESERRMSVQLMARVSEVEMEHWRDALLARGSGPLLDLELEFLKALWSDHEKVVVRAARKELEKE